MSTSRGKYVSEVHGGGRRQIASKIYMTVKYHLALATYFAITDQWLLPHLKLVQRFWRERGGGRERRQESDNANETGER